MQTRTKERIPWLMAGGRALLGPVVILGEQARWNGLTLAALIVAALLSDIFDGVLARRWKCDTAAVRLFDSIADIVCYAGCAIALWMRHPGLVRELATPVIAVIASEILCLGIAFVKFRKPPSYHSYLAKIWGLVLASALVAAFVTKHPAGWLLTALALGVLSNLEGITLSLLMPVWRHDIRTIWHALILRRRLALDRQRTAKRASRIVGGVIAATLFAAITLSACASSIASVTFTGGTSPGIATSTPGELDAQADQLSFRWSNGSLVIPYEKIQNFSYREKRAVNLGVLPTILVRLVSPEIYQHMVSITYLDPSGQKQVAIFRVPKQTKDTLPVILQERTGLCAEQYQLPCRSGAAASSQKSLVRSGVVEIPRR